MKNTRLVYTAACMALVALLGLAVQRPVSPVMAADDLGTWVRLADLPARTQEVAVAEAGGLIYVIGGQQRDGAAVALTSAVWAYDPAADSWSPKAPLPGTPRDHIGAASVGGKIYAIGGLTGWPAPSVPWVYEYNPLTNAWTQKADMPNPRPDDGLPSNPGRGAMGVAVIGGEIYVAGGVSGLTGALADVEAVQAFAKYNPATNSWTELPAMPTGRDHLVGLAVGGKFHAIGGRNVAVDQVTGVHEVFDPATGTWGNGAPMPEPRGGMGAGVLNGKIIVYGGEGPPATGWIWASTDEYDPATNSWRSLTPMGVARHGVGGASYNGAIYAPGGGELAGGEGESVVHERFTYAETASPTATVTPSATVAPSATVTTTPETGFTLENPVYLPAVLR
jgi:N-acetylneuraminic acid mutarotase